MLGETYKYIYMYIYVCIYICIHTHKHRRVKKSMMNIKYQVRSCTSNKPYETRKDKGDVKRFIN